MANDHYLKQDDLFSWAEVIKQRELLEQREREEALRKGREEWAKIKEEIFKQANKDLFKVKGLTK